MALKAIVPLANKQRLKLFMYGDAGVGKTTASCVLPAPYIIDSEKGTVNYSDMICKCGGAVFQTTDMNEVREELRQLRTEKHNFKTLVIDSITPLYFNLVEYCEKEYGTEYGRHYGEANKIMRGFVNLLMSLDMNVIITAHSKVVYGDNMQKIGLTFDGWKKLDYIFDLVLELRRLTPTRRQAKVVKTRIDTFPDGEKFEWTYSALLERYDNNELSRETNVVTTASDKQQAEVRHLANNVDGGTDYVRKCLVKIGIEVLNDLTDDQADKIIEGLSKKIGVANV